MEPYLPEFDRIHVISDLHMGGQRGLWGDFQIFNKGERLAAFIRSISENESAGETALILNGDTFDSLAEEVASRYAALRADEAVLMMERIYRDPSFKPVWESLGLFVRKPKNHLVFIIGNHDIELALPVVEGSIRDQLAGEGKRAVARIHFASHGGGFACRVGGARVFCTHGNEVDDWNWVDYNLLGQLSNALNAGRDIDAKSWKPNAGTRLVVDVMNSIKRDHAFVDLMKPLAASVASVAVALDKDLFRRVDLTDIWPLLGGRFRGWLATRKLLGQEADALTVPPAVVAQAMASDLLGSRYGKAVQKASAASPEYSEDALLLAAESAMQEGRQAVEAASDEDLPETLGIIDLFSGLVGLVSKEEGLRLALLDWLEDDRSDDLTYEDELYQAMQKRIGSGVHFLVTGHTHEPRALRGRSPKSFYFNCGTWIRTLRFTREVLESKEEFAALWPTLKNGTLAALDAVEIPGKDGARVRLIQAPTYAVRIERDGEAVVGRLLRVNDGSTLETVDGSLFRVVAP